VTSTEAGQARLKLLQREMRRIGDSLAEQPQVRQMWVFGSVVSGATHEWSDLDLAIIAESDEPFLKRSVALARMLQPQVGVQFLVYTPAEIQTLRDRPFIRQEILEKGKLVPLHPQKEAQRWLNFAKDDLQMARYALDERIHNQVCFHAQQCMEKVLKACLTLTGEPVPRSHLLVDLFKKLSAESQQAMAEIEAQLAAIDQFYIPTRYPDALPGALPDGLPDQNDARLALVSAERCYALGRELVERA
jgi:HEPN domain-containing protein/predicted nucleotidyltransferase